MEDKDISAIIAIVRRAPLHNMDEAEQVAQLLQRFVQANAQIPEDQEMEAKE